MRIFIKTFGCSSNRAETAALEDLLEGSGFEITNGYAPAEAVVVNSCTVRRDTELKVMKYLSSVHGKKVVVTGCMAEVQPSAISSAFPGASIVSPHNLPMVAEALAGDGRIIAMDHSSDLPDPAPFGKGVRHVVAISRGCLGSCTYCIVRLARGSLASLPSHKIVRSVSSAVDLGAREVFLSAQDCGVYGVDIGTDLPALLSRVSRLEGDFRVRVGMFGPSSVMPYLGRLEGSYGSGKIYKFAHIPAQSGSDAVLGLMGRPYAASGFRRVVSSLRAGQPGLTLYTDVIVGFPGETEADFAETCQLIEDVRPSKTHIARFSPRPHTPAYSLRQVPEEVKKRRSQALTDLARRVQMESNAKWVGRAVSAVAVDSFARGGVIARTDEYKTVALPGAEKSLIGSRVDVAITSATPFFLLGEISRR
jgi:threonylcarbamoyladenosine tRNA methylthiotransferase CDKAL1